MMENSIRLYSLNYSSLRMYAFAALFAIGNIVLPQVCHLLPIANGGLIFLPIYFFTLIAAYKYGIWTGVLTAILSPVINNLVFGMPPSAVLPIILIKSVLLACVAAYAARKFRKVSLLALIGTVLVYQFVGTGFEWILVQDFYLAVQDFRIGLPGILIQVFGGYFLLKSISKI